MAPRSFSFATPTRRFPTTGSLRLGALFAGTAFWLLIYCGLALRMWSHGVQFRDPLTLGLSLLAIVLGVGLLAAWVALWSTLPLPWRKQGTGGWPALSLPEIQALSPSEFEEFVAQRIFVRQQYQVRNTPDVKDGGVDIRLLDNLAYEGVVQCKRYASTVGVSTVRDLFGTMIHDEAAYAFLTTSGPISADAQEWVKRKPIGLLDGEMIAWLARDGVDPTYLQSRYRPLPFDLD